MTMPYTSVLMGMARHVVCAWKTVAGPVQSLSVREGRPITAATANTAIIIKDNYH